MKDGWQLETLGDLCEFQRGLTYAKGDEVDFSTNVVLRATNIDLATNLIDLSELKYINENVAVPNSRKVKKGSLLICTASGSKRHLGKVAYIDRDYDYAFGGFMGMITSKEGLVPRYLFHLMTSKVYKDFISELADGVNINNLKFDELKNFPVPHPAPPEQKRIVRVLDEAFNGIATIKANAEKNLKNALALLDATFKSIMTIPDQDKWTRTTVANVALSRKGSIRTGPFGSQLLHGEFVNEGIAVLGIDNAVANEFRWGRNRCITPEKYEQLARYQVRPGDVLITIMGTCGRCAIVPDDIPTAINTKHLCCITLDHTRCLPGYLHAYFLHHSDARDFLSKKAKGSIMEGLNMGIIAELPLILPPIDRQELIIAKFDALRVETKRLEELYKHKLVALEELTESLLGKAFAGELIEQARRSIVIPFPKSIPSVTTTDLHAGILAIAYQSHENNQRQRFFGNVKAEKISHMVEAYVGIDLGRDPVKDAAGPDDYPHLQRVKHRAQNAGFFLFSRTEGLGYRITKGRNFDALIDKTRSALGDRNGEVDALVELMLPMDTREAEVFATVYAAWNNLLLDRQPITHERIVFEARENWHPDKLLIPRSEFFNAINLMKQISVIPQGKGKRVDNKLKRKGR